MPKLFNNEYRLTWNDFLEAAEIGFIEHDTKTLHVVKDRFCIFSYCRENMVDFLDIPREFFEQNIALKSYKKITYNEINKEKNFITSSISTNIDHTDVNKDKICIIECIVDGPLFRTMVFGYDEWKPEDFIDMINRKTAEKQGKKLEESSETIETTESQESCCSDGVCNIDFDSGKE